MGETHVAYAGAPKWSFAGGRPRVGNGGKRSQSLGDVTGVGLVVVPDSENEGAGEATRHAGEADLRRQGAPRKSPLKAKKKLCRGFGSQTRLPMKGSMYQMPYSPGPAAYDVPRDCDLKPLWSAETLVPWGKRTEQRPECSFRTSTDAGPGEHTAHHPFYGPFPTKAAVFGHPLREPAAENHVDTQYDLPSFITDGPQIKFGTGSRPDFTGGEIAGRVSPDAYHPDYKSIHPAVRGAGFGTSLRAHESEAVDPDEPPGPGAHEVRRGYAAEDKPGTGLGRAERKTTGDTRGCGADAFYNVQSGPCGQGCSMGLPRGRREDNIPGPGTYDPSDHLCYDTPPAWVSPAYTAVRRMEGEKVGRALEESRGSKLKPVYPHFVPGGPKFSLGRRRQKIPGMVGGWYLKETDVNHRLDGGYSSMG